MKANFFIFVLAVIVGLMAFNLITISNSSATQPKSPLNIKAEKNTKVALD
jgi:hypothetical protein